MPLESKVPSVLTEALRVIIWLADPVMVALNWPVESMVPERGRSSWVPKQAKSEPNI